MSVDNRDCNGKGQPVRGRATADDRMAGRDRLLGVDREDDDDDRPVGRIGDDDDQLDRDHGDDRRDHRDDDDHDRGDDDHDRGDGDGDDGDDELDHLVGAGDDQAELPEVSRKVRRRRRRTRPRSRTIAMKRLTREELRLGALMFPPVDVPRPRTRMECRSEARPCPWVACKYHLYLDVNPETGSIKINFPDLEPWEMQQTCSLDVAERGGITLEEVGEIMNLTRERIRQVEVRGLLKLKMASPSPDEVGAALLRRPGQ